MSDTTQNAENTTSQEDGKTQEEPKKTFSPIESQEDLDRIINKRLNREKAKYGDYEELKSKAAKFDELEAKNKSELELMSEAKSKLEEELKSIKATNQQKEWIAAAAERTGVPAKLIKGKSEDEINEAADELKAAFDDVKADKKYPNIQDGGKPATNDDQPDMEDKIVKAFQR